MCCMRVFTASVWLVFAMMCMTSAGVNAQVPSVAREAQAAERVAGLDWEQIPDVDRPLTGIVTVSPARFSGAVGTPGSSTDVDTNEAFVPSGAVPVRRFAGDWRLAFSWKPKSPKVLQSGKFEIWEPLDFPNDRVPRPLFDPLRAEGGGTCLVHFCFVPGRSFGRPPLIETELRPWDRATLLPADWSAQFPNAWERVDEVRAVLGGDQKAENIAALRKLALDSNGPISILAFRKLLALGKAPLNFIEGLMTEARGGRLSAGLYLLGLYAGDLDEESLSKSMLAICAQAKDEATVRAWAAGGLAAGHFCKQQTPQAKFGAAILNQAKARARELGLNEDGSKDLFEAKAYPLWAR